MKTILLLLFPLLLLVPNFSHAQESLKGTSGKINYLRVNETGVIYGPPNDNIAAEVIVKLAGDTKAYGFQLRKDGNEIAHLGMLNLLRDAYLNDLKVGLSYYIKAGKKTGRIIVVQLNK